MLYVLNNPGTNSTSAQMYMYVKKNSIHLSHTYQLEGMQRPKGQPCFSAAATAEGETSHYQEDDTDAIENGCVFKAEREIHSIMARGVRSRRIIAMIKAGICFSPPLQG